MLLKRGLSATLDEFLLAAEYILKEGNEKVLLCERGIRTFETGYRFTLDLLAVPVLKERTHLPVIVDPSHAGGQAPPRGADEPRRSRGGADGIIVEVHPHPRGGRVRRTAGPAPQRVRPVRRQGRQAALLAGKTISVG